MSENQVANIRRGEIPGKIGTVDFILVPTLRNIQQVETYLGEKYLVLTTRLRVTKVIDLSVEQAVQILTMTQKGKKTFDEIGQIVVEQGLIKALPIITKFIIYALQGHTAFDDDGEVIQMDEAGNIIEKKKEEPGNGAAEPSQK